MREREREFIPYYYERERVYYVLMRERESLLRLNERERESLFHPTERERESLFRLNERERESLLRPNEDTPIRRPPFLLTDMIPLCAQVKGPCRQPRATPSHPLRPPRHHRRQRLPGVSSRQDVPARGVLRLAAPCESRYGCVLYGHYLARRFGG